MVNESDRHLKDITTHTNKNMKSKLSTVIAAVALLGLMAISTNTPMIAIPSNTFKMEAVLEDAGLDQKRLKPANSLLSENFSQFETFSNQERAAITTYLSEGRQKMAKLFSNLRQLAR